MRAGFGIGFMELFVVSAMAVFSVGTFSLNAAAPGLGDFVGARVTNAIINGAAGSPPVRDGSNQSKQAAPVAKAEQK